MILSPEIAALISSLQRELEALRAENAELPRRLEMNSSTSSKPPSSDGLRERPASLREPSDRPGGGGKATRARPCAQTAEPDRIVTHEAAACRHCGAAFSRREATGGVGRSGGCSSLPSIGSGLCRSGESPGAFSEGVTGPAQYGDRLRAAPVYLHARQLIPVDRTAEALADLTAADGLCAARGGMDAPALALVAEQIGALIRAARALPRRDGPANRRQDAMAAYDGHRNPHTLPRLRQAWRDAGRPRRRRHRL